jgi:hypothetical protein
LPISYRSLIPKANECTNLLTPTCPSSSHIAYGAIRLEWTFMILGQSAAAAAVLAMERGLSPQQLPYEDLKSVLLKAEQILQR